MEIKIFDCYLCRFKFEYESDDIMPDDDYPDTGYLLCPKCGEEVEVDNT